MCPKEIRLFLSGQLLNEKTLLFDVGAQGQVLETSVHRGVQILYLSVRTNAAAQKYCNISEKDRMKVNLPEKKYQNGCRMYKKKQ